MAFRAAAATTRHVMGVVALGGDVPPEIEKGTLRRIPCVLLGRGVADEWYTHEKFAADERRLRDAGTLVTRREIDGGHDWSADFSREAATFLAGLV